MNKKKCEFIREFPIQEQIIRAIAKSKNKTIVNVTYETHNNVTVIDID